MLAKRTAKTQLILPKAIVQTAGSAEYFDVSVEKWTHRTDSGAVAARRRRAGQARGTQPHREGSGGSHRLGAPAAMTPPRVVLDTHCILSAPLFAQGRLVWLREGWRTGQFMRATAVFDSEQLFARLH